MTETDKDDMSRVEAFLDEFTLENRAVPDALTQRVLADARRLQPPSQNRTLKRKLRQGWLASVGGWPALGGLAAASCTGFWFGLSTPVGVIGDTLLGDGPGWVLIEDGADLTGFGWDVQEG